MKLKNLLTTLQSLHAPHAEVDGEVRDGEIVLFAGKHRIGNFRLRQDTSLPVGVFAKGNLFVDSGTSIVRVDGRLVKMSEDDCRILVCLLWSYGQAVPASHIFKFVWPGCSGELEIIFRRARAIQDLLLDCDQAIEPVGTNSFRIFPKV